MKIDRLFQIIYLLLDKSTISAKTLAEHFEVSTRTIYRDVETLSSAGIPIYMKKGKGGGISLLPEFILNKTVLTEKEKSDILSSLQAINSVNYTETDKILKKLSSMFGTPQMDWIEIDFSTWVNTNNEKMVFDQLKTAILSKLTVNFSYSNAKGENMMREIEPLKLCYKSNSWYLYGYCRDKKDFRFFKLKRIKKLSILEENFTRNTPKNVFNDDDIVSDKNYIDLKLKISSNIAYRVYDEFENFEILEDGSFIVELNVSEDDWIVGYILSLGEDCEVLAPDTMRYIIKERLENISKYYH